MKKLFLVGFFLILCGRVSSSQSVPLLQERVGRFTDASVFRFDVSIPINNSVAITLKSYEPKTSSSRSQLWPVEQIFYRSDGSLEKEVDCFYDEKGVMLGTVQTDFDLKSRYIRSVFLNPGEVVEAEANAPIKRYIRVLETKLAGATLQSPKRRIEYSNPKGDGSKVAFYLGADGRIKRKGATRLQRETDKIGRSFLSSYNARGLRTQTAYFSSSGVIKERITYSYNVAHQFVEARSKSDQIILAHCDYNAFGYPREIRALVGTAVETRVSVVIDSSGHLHDSRTFLKGKLIVRLIITYDAKGKRKELTLIQYDADGNVLQRRVNRE